MIDKPKILKEQIYKIQSLSATELEDYAISISLSNLSKDMMEWLYKAIDIRREEVLSTVCIENSLAVCSDIDSVS